MKTAKRCLIGMMILNVLLIALPAAAQEAGRRVIGTPDFVVILKDDGSLEHFEVINSVGYLLGVTLPGWRNDRLGQQVIHTVTGASGTRAELWHLSGDQYEVIFYRVDNSKIGSGTFSAAGVPGAQAEFASHTATTPTTAATPIVTTPITTTSGRRDNGASLHAQGTFDGTYYRVAPGDNLFRIALRFNTTFKALQAFNNIPNPNRIYTGMLLRIP